MIQDIPVDFHPYAHFIIAAEDIKRFNPIASHVLTQVFVDICQDVVHTTTNPAATDFLKNLTDNLPDFPRDGPEETKLLADDLYDSIRSTLRSGKVTKQTAHQLWLCGVLYSVLAGDEAIKRERICKISAARVRKMLLTSAISPDNTTQQQQQPSKLHHVNTELHMKSQKPSKNPLKTFQSSSKINKVNLNGDQPNNASKNTNNNLNDQNGDNGVSFESLMSHFDEAKAMQYLSALGANMSYTPQLNEKCKPSIAQKLDLSLSCLARDDFEQAASFLNAAQRAWKTGKP
ncbi:hypothetical protein TRFO_03962 [Tritrichomonas foetus]|uniref:Uncharacterized protein n=1 Tax=Tritrichomonas foetus TaxID=1144522 RepID=A0A1J4KIZ3_9EUKA|nr:hypothetical protein TRFO_03962 [Tritrichomonas foetus]|eukprot:OHT11058.1 hypothetical protein TRFO_03962 [Tritrichomonas foetus]